MNCKSCSSDNRLKFVSEINIHFPGLKNLDKPTVFVFPKLLVCMDCGFTEFSVPETELRMLGKDAVAHAITTSHTPERSVDLSEFVSGFSLRSSEIEIGECAANEPLALKYGLYRH